MTRLGLGCMRLSPGGPRRREHAIALIRAALDGGVRLLDTADVYCTDHRDIGHNEELVREAVDGWQGERESLTIATKGGLTRPHGRWVPDGRARHLIAACEASVERLGRPLDLYLLHTLDRTRKLSTSVRALAKLQARGLARRVGLCNVRVHELRQARDHAEISAVQVALSPFDDRAIRNGLVAYCRDQGIQLIAHSPFGGPRAAGRIARHEGLKQIAARHQVSPYAVARAWLTSLSDTLWPIPGPTRLVHAQELAAASELALSEDELAELDAAFPASDILRRPASERRPADDPKGDVVMIMGVPAAGKTSAVKTFVEQGYLRLNRDEAGGTLADLIPILRQTLASGLRQVVLDNTYPRRETRNEVIEAAWAEGAPARCIWLETSLADAQVNACQRLVHRYEHLPSPEDLKQLNRRDPNAFPPHAQFHYQDQLEPPILDEGFAALERVPFVRRPSSGQARAVLLDPAQLSEAHLPTLAARVAQGYLILGIGWSPDEHPPPSVRFGELEIPTLWCTHPRRNARPICWCAKPLPGLALQLIQTHGLDPSACEVWGRGPAERGLASRIGARSWAL